MSKKLIHIETSMYGYAIEIEPRYKGKDGWDLRIKIPCNSLRQAERLGKKLYHTTEDLPEVVYVNCSPSKGETNG